MKPILLLLVAVSVAVPSQAADLKGKWGLSAPIFFARDASSYSLLYAHSDRSVWAVDLALRFRDQITDDTNSQVSVRSPGGNAFSVSGGPRLRSYRRPEADLSFYLDRFLRGAYSSAEVRQFNGSSTTNKEFSVGGGVGIGCEYFVPRLHIGIAAHSDLASVVYVKDSAKTNLLGAPSATSSVAEFNFSLQPALVLRAYF